MLQVNDTVRLITLERQECESYFGPDNIGWMADEKPQPQIGDTFEVIEVGHWHTTWLKLKGLENYHPASKFLKVDKI